MTIYRCGLCTYPYDSEKEGTDWDALPADWTCPVCGSKKSAFEAQKDEPVGTNTAPPAGRAEDTLESYLDEWRRQTDEVEKHLSDIHEIAITGGSIIEPMRTREPTISWDEILIKGAQLARLPLNKEVPVVTTTVIGPNADEPLVIDTPVYVTHMSFGALSKEAKIALATGSAAVKSAMCSGEGGILPASLAAAHRYIFEYVPNKYSVTDAYLKQVDAVEIKIGQSAKPGMGGHLPGNKVTEEIARVRGFPPGRDIISPACFPEIRDDADLARAVDDLRKRSGGKPIGIKLAAGNIEADMAVALRGGVDFITLDGRAGATGAAPKFIKAAASVPSIFALSRARRFLDEQGATGVSLLVTGGFRISADIAKALAMGADAVAIGTAAMMAIGCQQYRVCASGLCPVGIATQDPELRGRLKTEKSAKRLENFLRVTTAELKDFARLTGNDDVHQLALSDLCTVNLEISNHTPIEHV